MDLQEIVAGFGTALLFGGLIGFEAVAAAHGGAQDKRLVAIGAADFVVFSMTVSGDNSPIGVAAHIVSCIAQTITSSHRFEREHTDPQLEPPQTPLGSTQLSGMCQ